MSDAIATAPSLGSRRRRVMGSVVGLLLLAGAAWFAWWHTIGQFREFTDDAYVGGNLVQITPQVPGAVISIGAEDNEYVQAGQTLVQLDPAEARVALEAAEAQLAQTVRRLRNLMATTPALEAAVAQRQAELARAQADLTRRERITLDGAVSAEELQHARDTRAGAAAALEAAQQALLAHRTLIDGPGLDSHPEVQAAAARVREASLQIARLTLSAPIAGFVARRSVQPGQRVNPGAPLMTVIALDQVWVDANFKERQLAHLRLGQPVQVQADLYGDEVVYHGRVAGFSAGTGGAFALLPPQNASGNWIKIVQRVPVRIALDPQELAQHPLQVGLSMRVEVDTHGRDGERLPRQQRSGPAAASRPAGEADPATTRRIAAIIAANGGRPAP